MTLVDSIGKKTTFLRTVAGATGLAPRVDVETQRSESLAADRGHRERADVVTARAVGSLGELVELAFPLLRPGGRLIAWKRGETDAELAEGRRAGDALGGGSVTVHEVPVSALPGHRLVEIRKLGRTPPEYPRDPASRRRQPW